MEKRSLPSNFRTASIALVGLAALVLGVGEGCSSDQPPVVTTSGTPSNLPGDGGVVYFDATPFLDTGKADTTVSDSDTGQDAVVGHDSAEPDTSQVGDDSGRVDVASLPDVQSLDNYVPCGFLSCSPGCCNGANVCVSGADDDACGGSGNPCQNCLLTNQTCQSFTCR